MERSIGIGLMVAWSAGTGVGLALGRVDLVVPMGLLAMLTLLALVEQKKEERHGG